MIVAIITASAITGVLSTVAFLLSGQSFWYSLLFGYVGCGMVSVLVFAAMVAICRMRPSSKPDQISNRYSSRQH